MGKKPPLSRHTKAQQRQRLKEVWFDRAVQALNRIVPGYLERVSPNEPYLYLCPLCEQFIRFSAIEANWLTFEHAPPKWMGQKKGIALTCGECNQTLGDKLDGPAARYARDRKGQFIAEGLRFNVGLESEDANRLTLLVPGKQPGHERLRGLLEQGKKFEIRWAENEADRRASAFAHLKASYIIAFAAFGYRYVLSRALKPVRQQLQNPEALILDSKSFGLHNPSVSSRTRGFLFVTDPVELQSVVVRIGRNASLLPPSNNPDFYSTSRQYLDHGGKPFSLRGYEQPFPTEPMHSHDVPLAIEGSPSG